MIVRVPKEERTRFLTASYESSNDSRLSFKALGLHLYLLGKPDDWDANEDDLVKRHEDGKASVRAGIAELLQYGYMHRQRITDDRGRVIRWRLDTYESPLLNPYFSPDCEKRNVGKRNVEPDSGFPDVGFPDVGFPDVGNQHVTNTNSNYNRSEQLLSEGDSERTPAQDDATPPTVPETPTPAIEEPPVPQNPLRISLADQMAARAARAQQIKDQLPEEIYDPPSVAALRLRAAQAQLPDAPPPSSKRKPDVDKTYVKQRLSSEGYIKSGTGTTAVEVYYERFSAYDAEAKLTAPQQDDLVKACTDLEKLRAVVEEYSRRPYKARNVKLILDWYSKGIQENGNGNSRPNSAQSSQQRPANERRALGKAPSVTRQQAKDLFANHYLYNQNAAQ